MWWLSVFTLLLLLQESCFGGGLGTAQKATLTWMPSSGAAGYAIYYGTTDGAMTARVDAGTNMAAIIPNLVSGARYHFVVVAYDAGGFESDPSNEIVFTVPVQLMMLSMPSSTMPATFQFTCAAGHSYQLQASRDMRTWTTVWQSGVVTATGFSLAQDVFQPVPDPQRFYRLVVK